MGGEVNDIKAHCLAISGRRLGGVVKGPVAVAVVGTGTGGNIHTMPPQTPLTSRYDREGPHRFEDGFEVVGRVSVYEARHFVAFEANSTPLTKVPIVISKKVTPARHFRGILPACPLCCLSNEVGTDAQNRHRPARPHSLFLIKPARQLPKWSISPLTVIS